MRFDWLTAPNVDTVLLAVNLILLVSNELISGTSAVAMRRLRLVLRLSLVPTLTLLLLVIGVRVIALL